MKLEHEKYGEPKFHIDPSTIDLARQGAIIVVRLDTSAVASKIKFFKLHFRDDNPDLLDVWGMKAKDFTIVPTGDHWVYRVSKVPDSYLYLAEWPD